MLRKLHIAAISLVLLFFLQIPLGFIAFSGAAGVLFSLMLLTPLIALQVLTLKALQRRFPLNPAANAKTEELNHETHEMNEKEKQSPLINAD